MGIFDEDGQAEVLSLSDEDIAKRVIDAEKPEDEIVEENNSEERQGTDLPQPNQDNIDEEANNQEPQDTVEKPAKEVNDDGEQTTETPASAGQAEVVPIKEHELIKKNYAEVRSWSSKLSNENRDLKNRIAELEAATKIPALVATPSVDEDKLLADIINNPSQTIEKIVQDRLAEALKPQEEAKRAEALRQEFSTAYAECANDWGQLNTKEGQEAVVLKMTELSSMAGDVDAWKKDPSTYILRASKSLWGIPTKTDQAAIDAAVNAARAKLRAEMSELPSNMTITNSGNQQILENEKDPAEMIRGEMRMHSGTNIFGE